MMINVTLCLVRTYSISLRFREYSRLNAKYSFVNYEILEKFIFCCKSLNDIGLQLREIKVKKKLGIFLIFN